MLEYREKMVEKKKMQIVIWLEWVEKNIYYIPIQLARYLACGLFD